LVEGFTKQYKVHSLVYFEITESIESAIDREKKLKKWNREWKIRLIEKSNPEWRDLYSELI
jgi:putative endonuclease